jgi:hypothetical protein
MLRKVVFEAQKSYPEFVIAYLIVLELLSYLTVELSKKSTIRTK